MRQLWAPWRIEYILGPKADGCVFCLDEDTGEDDERMVLLRARHCFVIMNKYPYCNGHIMVAPYAHWADVTQVPDDVGSEFFRLIKASTKVLNEHFKPDGINIGINMGAAAGAGVKEHLHCHLVPRWNGDSNFMAVFADVRTIPQHIRQSYQDLKPCFENLRFE